jgi:anti-sigma factor RsiW
MRNGIDRNSCLFGEELVAYIYGELSPADRFDFEKHLLVCSGCTAEFAEISFSRLGVYEWHRDEFVPLATPYFEIPYPVSSHEHPVYSWVDALRNLVSPMRLAFAGGSLAAIVFGTVIFNNLNKGDETVAAAVVPAVNVAADVNESTLAPDPVKDKLPSAGKSTTDSAADTARQYKAVQSSRQIRAVEVKAPSIRKPQNIKATNAVSAPRLGNFVEAVDTSLRLADLVADIDTKDIK